jgi:hypothetical protein
VSRGIKKINRGIKKINRGIKQAGIMYSGYIIECQAFA